MAGLAVGATLLSAISTRLWNTCTVPPSIFTGTANSDFKQEGDAATSRVVRGPCNAPGRRISLFDVALREVAVILFAGVFNQLLARFHAPQVPGILPRF